jgi:oligopeptidase A
MSCRVQATANGHKDATPESGPWVITLDMPVYLPCMENLVNRELRETLYRAFVTRASSGEKDNAPIIKRILQIRREMAQTLGYSCHAEKSLAAKMAPSVQSVMDLTKMLREKSFSAAQRELEEVTAFANKVRVALEQTQLFLLQFPQHVIQRYCRCSQCVPFTVLAT